METFNLWPKGWRRWVPPEWDASQLHEYELEAERLIGSWGVQPLRPDSAGGGS